MTIQFKAAPGLPLPPGGAAPAAVVLGGGTCTLYSARVYFFHRKIEMSRSEPRVDLGWAKGLTLQEVVSCTVQTHCSSSCRKSEL